MNGVDTNILVRLVIDDDKEQVERARSVLERGIVFVPRTVMVEAEWVLRGIYRLKRGRILSVLRAFAGLQGVVVENADQVDKALGWFEAGMDFADAMHLAAAGTCNAFLTFDRDFIRSAARLDGVIVTEP